MLNGRGLGYVTLSKSSSSKASVSPSMIFLHALIMSSMYIVRSGNVDYLQPANIIVLL